MEPARFTRVDAMTWQVEPVGAMRVPAIIYADEDLIRSPSTRGVAEEAPGAYKDVDAVVAAAEHAGLARRVARLQPLICIKG